MKRLISILVICLLFACQVAAQLQKNNLKELNLRGKVKVMAEISYDAVEKDGVVQIGDRRSATVIDFNESGNMTRKRYFESIEVIYQKDTCMYDGEGHMIGKDIYNRWGKPETKLSYKYDGNQKMLEKISYEANGKFNGHSIYKYNKYGRNLNVIDEFFYGEDGSRLGGSNTFRYDSLWNLIGEMSYSYKYDSNGNMIEKTSNSISSPLDPSIFQYEYDKNLNWIKRNEFRNGVQIAMTERIIAYY